MIDATVMPEAGTWGPPCSPRPGTPQAFVGILALTFSLSVGALILRTRIPVLPDPAPLPVATARSVDAPTYSPLLDPAFSGFAPVSLAQSAPLGAGFAPFSPSAPAAIVVAAIATPDAGVPGPLPIVPEALPEPLAVPLPVPAPAPDDAQLVQSIPFPPPRPPDLRLPAPPSPVRVPVVTAKAAQTPGPPDRRNFFEKLFGVQPAASGPVLAYAAPEDNYFGRREAITGNPPRQAIIGNPPPSSDRQTAIYNIADRTVYMPNGTRLEAHSGLGERLDDPRYVHERNRGPTPPHVYDLEPRAQLFHGVQALRLNPVGGGGVFGRTGLLAHTFMLGPNGDSNGCVSFRNYNAFLQAYRNGEIRRLVVVAGR